MVTMDTNVNANIVLMFLLSCSYVHCVHVYVYKYSLIAKQGYTKQNTNYLIQTIKHLDIKLLKVIFNYVVNYMYMYFL